jgi:hypothetical protein
MALVINIAIPNTHRIQNTITGKLSNATDYEISRMWKLNNITIIPLIISSSSSSAYHSPLLDIGLSNIPPSRSIFGYLHPAPASRPAQIVTPPGLRASYATFT